MCDLCLFDGRFQTNKVIKQSRNNDGLLVTRVVVADDKTGGQLFDRPGPRGKRRAGIVGTLELFGGSYCILLFGVV